MDSNTDSTISYYLTYDEDNRIKRDQAHQIEFLLTMDVLKEIFSKLDPCKTVIADIGCGTGNYTIELESFASKLYACDLMPNLLKQLSIKINQRLLKHIIPVCSSAEQLTSIPDKSCDVTLCMGPLYHLCEPQSRTRCFSELRRITKDNGFVVITYLNPKVLFSLIIQGKMTMQEFEKNEMHEHFLIPPFYFTSPKWIEMELSEHGFSVKKHVALDTFTSFMIDTINSFNTSTYNNWLEILRHNMENPAWLDFSSHGLIVAKVRT